MPTALITGSSIRLGRAIALALAQSGYDLILHYHTSHKESKSLKEQAQNFGVKTHVISVDLSTETGQNKLIEACYEKCSSLDAIINNASIFKSQPFAKVSRGDYQKTLNINLQAPYFIIQGLLHLLNNSKNPCVVNMIDIMAYSAIKNYSHYLISKSGLLMLTKALALDLAPKIRVNAIAPGTVIFPKDYGEKQRKQISSNIPLANYHDAVDNIIGAALYLVKYAKFTTGSIINVDGGRSAKL